MDKSNIETAYKSARDLPSFQKMEREARELQTLLRVIPHNDKAQLKHQIDEAVVGMNNIAVVVDTFYDKLGERNWIFTNDLKMDSMTRIVELSSIDAAESALIDYYKSDHPLKFHIGRFYRFEAMRPRIHLIDKALDDYEHGRYYSVVLVLITVMDGFVNDIDKQTRRGLHAREEDELFSWDSVVGHHMGLTNAHKSFVRTAKKTVTEEVHELHRHGIVHGMLTEFDNVYVATKAWNRLFAVADWADAQQEHAKELAAPPEPSFFKQVKDFSKLQKDMARAEKFVKHDCVPDQDVCRVLDTVTDFLTRWQKQQWAPLAKHFMQFGTIRPSVSSLVQDAKLLYSEFPLESFQIEKIVHVGQAAAEASVTLHIDGREHNATLQWKHVDEDSKIVFDWLDGRWVLSPYGPTIFLR